MKNLAALIFCLLLTTQAAVADSFAHHLLESIASNRYRIGRYARMTGGHSRTISEAWIAIGVTSVPVAAWFDWRAKRFQQAGIPIMDLDFISMSLAPPFSTTMLPPLDDSVEYPDVPWRTWQKRLLELIAEKNFMQIHKEIGLWMKELAVVPRYHSLLRHMLESTARVAFLAPQYAAKAEALGMDSPVYLSIQLLKLHVNGLWAGVFLDKRAAPLQRLGVPIIVNDIPPVDMSPSLKDYDAAHCPEWLRRQQTNGNPTY